MLTPANEKDLAMAIAAARGPLRIQGGGTRPIGAPVDGETLSVAQLSGVTLYEPGALTLVARAGTPLAEIEATLAAEGQRLAFEPMDHRGLLETSGRSTIGGVVAGNISGSRRIQAGACRDSLLGVRFVDGAGRVLKNGGRVMKNVTGYDLVKLMAGSWGTLGVLSEVSFKVQAIPETQATLIAPALGVTEAVAKLSAALGSPFDLTGAAYLPAKGAAIRLEGLEASVNYRIGRLQEDICIGWDVLEGDQSGQFWEDVRDVRSLAGDAQAVWRVSLKPSDAPEFVAALGQSYGFDYALDWGGGLVWISASHAHLGDDAQAATQLMHAALQQAAQDTGGHATLIKAGADMRAHLPVFQPEAAPVAAISRQIRARFDPRAILNTGLMG